jgi:diadenosine tetraphosphate (Ap4A) HIT family hydrolase
MDFPRKPYDREGYERRLREGPCFICGIVDGRDPNGNQVIFRDELCVAWLNPSPPLLGYALLSPLEHRTGVVADFDEREYVELQRRVYRLGRAVSAALPTERLYVLTLGSEQGNSHVHWHIAPLPPGVPYREQQFMALVAERGLLDIPADYQAELAARIASRL